MAFKSRAPYSGCMELRAPDIETTTPQGWSSRRRQRGAAPCFVWRIAGAVVGMGLLRHDGEVESVVVVFWYSASVTARTLCSSASPKI